MFGFVLNTKVRISLSFESNYGQRYVSLNESRWELYEAHLFLLGEMTSFRKTSTDTSPYVHYVRHVPIEDVSQNLFM